MKVRELFTSFFLTAISCFAAAAVTDTVSVSEVKKLGCSIKSLRQLAMEKAELPGLFLFVHTQGCNSISCYAFILSNLLSDLLGIREEVVIKQNVIAYLYKFDVNQAKELSALFVDFDREHPCIADAGVAFVKWTSEHSFLSSPINLRRILRETCERSNEQCYSLVNSNSVGSMQTVCYRKNQAFTVAIKNMFPRDTLEDLTFGYLTVASFLLTNTKVGYSKKEINPVCFSQLRNALALDLYPQSALLVKDEVLSAIDSFQLEQSRQLSTNQSNILNLLSLISLSQNDGFVEKLIAKIDPRSVTEGMKSWIVQHFRSNMRTFEILKKHFKGAGWVLPENYQPLPIQMLTRALVSVHNASQFSEHFISYLPKQEVDVYHIDPSEGTFDVKKGIYTTCERVNWILTVTKHYQRMVSIIFPTGIKVTPLMLELLVKWALGEMEMTVEEERLARMIILVDQVTIIRHEPKLNGN